MRGLISTSLFVSMRRTHWFDADVAARRNAEQSWVQVFWWLGWEGKSLPLLDLVSVRVRKRYYMPSSEVRCRPLDAARRSLIGNSIMTRQAVLGSNRRLDGDGRGEFSLPLPWQNGSSSDSGVCHEQFLSLNNLSCSETFVHGVDMQCVSPFQYGWAKPDVLSINFCGIDLFDVYHLLHSELSWRDQIHFGSGLCVGRRSFCPLGSLCGMWKISYRTRFEEAFVSITTNGTLIRNAAGRIALIPLDRLHMNILMEIAGAMMKFVERDGIRAIAGFHEFGMDEEAGNTHGRFLANTSACPKYRRFEQILDEREVGVWWSNFTFSDGRSSKAKDCGLRPSSEVGGLVSVWRTKKIKFIFHSKYPRGTRSSSYYRDDSKPMDAPCWAGWRMYINADGQAIMCDNLF